MRGKALLSNRTTSRRHMRPSADPWFLVGWLVETSKQKDKVREGVHSRNWLTELNLAEKKHTECDLKRMSDSQKQTYLMGLEKLKVLVLSGQKRRLLLEIVQNSNFFAQKNMDIFTEKWSTNTSFWSKKKQNSWQSLFLKILYISLYLCWCFVKNAKQCELRFKIFEKKHTECYLRNLRFL